MTSADLVSFCGYLLTAWVLGFGGGFVMTRFKDAMNQIV